MPITSSHNKVAYRQKSKHLFFRWSRWLLVLLILIAVFADFIANEKPIYCQLDDQHYFPVLRSYAVDAGWADWQPSLINAEWKKLPYQSSIFPPIPYSPTTQDESNWYVSPLAQQEVPSLRFRHFLGTHQVGRDVASGLIHGTRKALWIGLLAMGIATLIGVFLGIIAGYFGDNQLEISSFQLVINILIFPFAVFYAFIQYADNPFDLSFERQFLQNFSIFFGIYILINSVFLFFKNKSTNEPSLNSKKSAHRGIDRLLNKSIKLPCDLIIMRLVEVMNAIPPLLLLLALVAVLEQSSLWHIAVLIGFMGWTGMTRFTRSEILKIKQLPYVEAARALGYTEWRVVFRHVLPNALSPLLIVLAFGMAGTILLEASLSFLGFGSGVEEVTWGKLLAQAREKPDHWWLAFFPGVAIFLTVMIFNILGDSRKS